MKRIIISLTAVLFVFGSACAQPDTLWTRTYGDISSDAGYGIDETEDGGFIIVGYTYPVGVGSSDLYLIKTDSVGDTIWTRTYGGDNSDGGYSIQQTDDGGFIMVGYTYDQHATNCLYLVKTDAYGDTIWTRAYNDYIRGECVRQTDDGGYIIAGTTQMENAAIIKTDSLGIFEWDQIFGSTYLDEGFSVDQTVDGGYIMTGSICLNPYGQSDVLIARTDSDGDSLWTKMYGSYNIDKGYCVQLDSEGGFVVAGKFDEEDGADNEPSIYLIKTDSNGDSIWTRIFGTNQKDWGNHMVKTTDGGYAITGACDVVIPWAGGNLCFMKADNDGREEWLLSFGGDDYERGYCVLQTSDGGYAVLGVTHSYGAGGSDIWLLRFESEYTSVEEQEYELPYEYLLYPPYPNPFNQFVRLNYMLPAAADARLSIYDITGREVATLADGSRQLAVGHHSLVWDAAGMASGVYFVRLSADGGRRSVKKVVLMK